MKLLVLLLLTWVMENPMTDTAAVDTTAKFEFTTIDSVAITPVKDQHRSGTCWCFSGIGFLESEILRLRGNQRDKMPMPDLSEMFVVNHTMMDRAEYVVRMYGHVDFAPGGWCSDVIYCLANYGLVPQSVMPGIQYGASPKDTLPVHTELDAIAKAYLGALTAGKLKKLTPVWKQGLQAVYDTYLGACPAEFEYEGKTYTPMSYAKSLGLNAADYMDFTSYTHHPFYTQFALEVPDNWRMTQSWNVPMDELMAIIDNALANGYTLAWAADISELTWSKKGVAVMPDADRGVELTDTDMATWLGYDDKQKKDKLTAYPMPEMEITQEMRQQAFDSWDTYDDHGMQIFGIAHDQNGKKYYMVKNSWGTTRFDYQGIWYVSEAYMRYKTNDITVHRDAVPKSILKKLHQ